MDPIGTLLENRALSLDFIGTCVEWNYLHRFLLSLWNTQSKNPLFYHKCSLSPFSDTTARYNARFWVIVGCYHSLEKKSLTYLFARIDVKYQVAYKFEIWLDKLKRRKEKLKDIFFLILLTIFVCSFFVLQVYQKLDSDYVVDACLTINEYGNYDFGTWSKM